MSFIPTKEWVEGLKVGDTVPTCFTKPGMVQRITYRGTDVKGRVYVGVYVTLSSGTLMSMSYKQDERVATIND